jgi:RecA-family ATPase
LFKDIIPCGKVILLVAPGGTGKTMFAIQLGASVATGCPFADVWETGETGGALLLLGEDDDEELHRRTLNACNQLRLLVRKPTLLSKTGRKPHHQVDGR